MADLEANRVGDNNSKPVRLMICIFFCTLLLASSIIMLHHRSTQQKAAAVEFRTLSIPSPVRPYNVSRDLRKVPRVFRAANRIVASRAWIGAIPHTSMFR